MSDNPKLKKNGGKGTNAGNFLRGLVKGGAKLLPTVLDLVGMGNVGDALGIINADPDNAGLTNEQVAELINLHEMDLRDLEGARMMYKDTDHEVADKIAMRVINYNLWVVLAALIIEIISVMMLEDKVLVAIVSSAIASVSTALIQERQQVIGFFFGSSRGSKQKQTELGKK